MRKRGSWRWRRESAPLPRGSYTCACGPWYQYGSQYQSGAVAISAISSCLIPYGYSMSRPPIWSTRSCGGTNIQRAAKARLNNDDLYNQLIKGSTGARRKRRIVYGGDLRFRVCRTIPSCLLWALL
ncbi:hypothetical protein LX36DRAFT_206516 [Colletotrichum falcatum]|nr:hypothetical protein LX36DRAFT_206516 [Colletotrichum falcatum]